MRLPFKLFICLGLIFMVLAPVAQAGPVLDRVLARKEVRVGLDANFPPMEMLDKKGEVIGYDVDLANAVASALGAKLVLVQMPFKDLLPALGKGKLDMAISGLTMTPQRNRRYVLVGPYMVGGQTALIKNNLADKVRGPGDLNNPAYTVAAAGGTTAAEAVRNMLPKAKFRPTKTELEAVRLLLENQVQGMVADLSFCAVAYFRHRKDGLVHFDRPFTFEPTGIAIAQGDFELYNFLDNLLALLKSTGRLDIYERRWFRDSSWMGQLP